MIEVSSSNGSSSSDDRSRKTVTRKATKKTTAPSTPTPTLPMFLERYPEVQDRSDEEQKHLYMVYTLHVKGATPDDLAKYTSTAFHFFGCCLDGATSTGCQVIPNHYGAATFDDSLCRGASPTATNEECYFIAGVCCASLPVNREGRRAWPWDNYCV